MPEGDTTWNPAFSHVWGASNFEEHPWGGCSDGAETVTGAAPVLRGSGQRRSKLGRVREYNGGENSVEGFPLEGSSVATVSVDSTCCAGAIITTNIDSTEGGSSPKDGWVTGIPATSGSSKEMEVADGALSGSTGSVPAEIQYYWNSGNEVCVVNLTECPVVDFDGGMLRIFKTEEDLKRSRVALNIRVNVHATEHRVRWSSKTSRLRVLFD